MHPPQHQEEGGTSVLVLMHHEEFRSAGKVVLVLQQHLPHSLVAVQDHHAKGAQVQGKYRPVLLCHLPDQQAESEATGALGRRGPPKPLLWTKGTQRDLGKDCPCQARLERTIPRWLSSEGALLQCTCTPAQLATLTWVWLVPLLLGQLPCPSPEATLPTSVP